MPPFATGLHEFRTDIGSYTPAASLQELVIFFVDKVIGDDHRLLLASKVESITLPDRNIRLLGSAACDAFGILEDLRPL